MIIVLFALVSSIILLRKNIKHRKIKLIGVLILSLIIGFLIREDEVKLYYHLSGNKCITVWHRSNGDVYIINEKYKREREPSDNYIKTTYNNAIVIIYAGDKEYDYVIFNNYGKSIEINMKNSKIKYYDYNEREEFYNKYYGEKSIKPQYKYFDIDIKERLTIIDGVGQ